MSSPPIVKKPKKKVKDDFEEQFDSDSEIELDDESEAGEDEEEEPEYYDYDQEDTDTEHDASDTESCCSSATVESEYKIKMAPKEYALVLVEEDMSD